jgi:hypothetical protein
METRVLQLARPRGRRGASLAGAAAAVAAAVAGSVVLEGRALADPTKTECFTTSQNGQELQHAGKLRAAREQFVTCAAASCPDLVRADCAAHLEEVQRAQPSIVFEVKDPAGADLSAVQVSVDGAVLVTQLDGRPIDMDPGNHQFRFEVAGAPAVEKPLLIREGEKDRHERIVIARPLRTASVAPSVAPIPTERGADGGTQRLLGWVAGGVGVVGVGVGAAFGLAASSKWSQAKYDCGTGCPSTSPAQSEKSTAEGDATASTVAFAVGGATLVAGVVLLLTAPTGREEHAPSVAVSLAPTVGRSGAGALVSVRY